MLFSALDHRHSGNKNKKRVFHSGFCLRQRQALKTMFAIWWSYLGSRLGPCLPHRKALTWCRNQDQFCVHVMSLAIQDLTASSRVEGLSDIMARHMDGGEGEQCLWGSWCHGEKTNQNVSSDSSGKKVAKYKSMKSSWKKDAKQMHKNSKLNFYTTWPGQVKTTQFIRRHQVSCCHNKAITARLPPWRLQHWRSLKRPDPKTQSRSAKILIFFSWTPVLFALLHFTYIQTAHF